MTNGFGSTPGPGTEHVNTLVARKGGKNKKRVQPTFVGSLGASGSSIPTSGNVPTSNVDGRLPPPPFQSSSRMSDTIDSMSTTSTFGRGFESAMDLDLSGGDFDRAFEGGMEHGCAHQFIRFQVAPEFWRRYQGAESSYTWWGSSSKRRRARGARN